MVWPLKWQGIEVKFLRKGRWPAENADKMYHSCGCLHVKNVSAGISYLVAGSLLISMVYFISLAQQAHLTHNESKMIIASTCLITLVGIMFSGALLYGIINEKPLLMLPYLISITVFFIASIIGIICLLVAILYGIEKRWEYWAEVHIWHKHMQSLAFSKIVLLVLVIIQGWMLIVHWRCFFYITKVTKREQNII